MSFDTLLTPLIIGGLGFMMFRGGGCCGSHSGRGKHKSGSKEVSGKTKADTNGYGLKDR